MINKIEGIEALKKIIKLHTCFNNYNSMNWLFNLIVLINHVEVFEITPSTNISDTLNMITYTIRSNWGQ